jgi:hypothetical protein
MSAQKAKPTCLSVFGDKAAFPSDEDLQRVLGDAARVWSDLIAHVSDTYEPIAPEWNFGGAKYGWSLRLRKRDRVVLYLIPRSDGFLVGIVLGAKAVAAAAGARLPVRVRELIAEAPRYAEGTGVRIPVVKKGDLAAIRTLTAIKMAQ